MYLSFSIEAVAYLKTDIKDVLLNGEGKIDGAAIVYFIALLFHFFGV